jgi:hypothetical protein
MSDVDTDRAEGIHKGDRSIQHRFHEKISIGDKSRPTEPSKPCLSKVHMKNHTVQTGNVGTSYDEMYLILATLLTLPYLTIP